MGKIKDLFMKFWADNIKKNYKKISVALGVFFNTTLLAILAYLCSVSSLLEPSLALMIGGLLLAVEGLGTTLFFLIFGKAQNGNGYGMPENKYILKLVKEDPELREAVKKKYTHRLLNGNHVANGH